MNTETYTPIKDLGVGKYTQIFFLSRITIVRDFAKVTLKDTSGEIEGVIWSVSDDIVAGEFYRICIETKLYKGALEFQTTSADIKLVEEPLNVNDYIKGVSEATLTANAAIIEAAFEAIDDEDYRNIIGSAIHKLDLIHALKNSPYGLDGPLYYKGGLLVHVASAIKLAQCIVSQIDAKINTSLVIASCLLRNIGWSTTTCNINGRVKARDAFYMVGVNRSSARYIDHLIIHVESDLGIRIPEAKKQALENACNMTEEIKTLEGRIAASIDDMVNLFHFGGDMLQRKENGNWIKDLFIGHAK